MSLSSSPASEPGPAMGAHRYWSVDSAPARLTQPLSVWAAPAVLALFVAVSTTMLLLVDGQAPLVAAFPSHDLLFSPYSGTHSVPLRIFILSFYIAFAVIVGAGAWARLRFLLELLFTYVLICGLFDLFGIFAYRQCGLVYSLHVVEIFSGLIGFFVFSLKLLSHGIMPERAPTPPVRVKRHFVWLPLLLAIGMAATLSILIDRLELPLVHDMRGIALLGGTGPGIFLFLPVLFLILYVAGTIRGLLSPPKPFTPPLTVIIPAHNEAHVIGRTLLAINTAAYAYRGRVTVLVLDNCSSDSTARAARTALAELQHIDGRVVDVPIPGKAVALNRGIEETNTQYLIRIDADTQVFADAFTRALRHFSDPRVGVVGGIPLPPGNGPFDRARLLEVLLKHGYYQIAYGAIDGIVGIPGMFAVYQTDSVRAAGGFVQGMNGEDTDIALRIAEMGFHIVGDPSVKYVSEVPHTYRHLREQRMRWFRSVYHVSARNRDYLDNWHMSLRGKAILPFMLLNSARRAMTVPLAAFGALHLLLGLDPISPLTWQAVLAVLIGAPALMGIFAALANGRVDALVGIPEYILFRFLRSYLTLEAVMSIAFVPPHKSVKF